MKALNVGIAVLALINCVASLHFYLEGQHPKCFIEELPGDTLVTGNYKAEEYDSNSNSWRSHPDMGVQITVEEIFDNNHRVVNKKDGATGRFTFTAAESGDHRLCFATSSHQSGWFSQNKVRFNLDMVIGESSELDSGSNEKVNDLVRQVRDLNARLHDIRREQIFQREREAEFRNQSESTNARVVKWTIVQLIVLLATCAWQLSHLQVLI